MVRFEFQNWSDAETDILAVIGLLQIIQEVADRPGDVVRFEKTHIDNLHLAERLLRGALDNLDCGRIP